MPQLKEWLTLTHVGQLGSATLNKLLNSFGTAAAILRAERSKLQATGISNSIIEGILRPNEAAIARDLEWLRQDTHHLITIQDDGYPKLLTQLSDPPMTLYVIGEKELVQQVLSEPQLAIVGSRNASTQGKQIASVFAEKLAQAGLVITSGLASGIDGAAHRGALQAQIGTTIAVTACGLDRVYPAAHRQLAKQIAQRGTIISEFPIGTLPMPGHFPRRNRIISGLSLGVLVVEASLNSGSLITARLASEQGREVFAIPGSIHSPLSRGCHALIRNGAKLVETVEDILEELKNHINFNVSHVQTRSTQADSTEMHTTQDPEHAMILNSMGYEPVSIDHLIERSGLRVEVVSSILLILELNGQVTNNGNGMYARAYRG